LKVAYTKPSVITENFERSAKLRQDLEALQAQGLRYCTAPRDRNFSCSPAKCAVGDVWDTNACAHVHLYCIASQSGDSSFSGQSPEQLAREAAAAEKAAAQAEAAEAARKAEEERYAAEQEAIYLKEQKEQEAKQAQAAAEECAAAEDAPEETPAAAEADAEESTAAAEHPAAAETEPAAAQLSADSA